MSGSERVPGKGNFQRLHCWQQAVVVRRACRQLAGRLPPEERFGLSDQLRRSGCSIAANISEGHSRGSRAEFIRFLNIARGSAREVENHLLDVQDLRCIPEDEIKGLLIECRRAARLISGLINSLKK
jgi:four helix bundle protein